MEITVKVPEEIAAHAKVRGLRVEKSSLRERAGTQLNGDCFVLHGASIPSTQSLTPPLPVPAGQNTTASLIGVSRALDLGLSASKTEARSARHRG
jgi:hypothetical protein